jgi:hypothetical protein
MRFKVVIFSLTVIKKEKEKQTIIVCMRSEN